MFPALRNVTPERIKEKLDSGRTPAQVAFWLTSNTVSRELNIKIPTSLVNFVGELQDGMILEPKEKSDLMVHILNNQNITALDLLCGFLLSKSDGDIKQFISILEQTTPLSQLGQFMRNVLARCEEVNCNGGATDEDRTNWILTTNMELPLDMENTVIEKISTERIDFSGNVLKLQTQVICVKKKSILLQLKILDLWDLHNLQCDLLFGMFSGRLVSWLRGYGIKIDKECIAVTITGIAMETQPNLQASEVVSGIQEGDVLADGSGITNEMARLILSEIRGLGTQLSAIETKVDKHETKIDKTGGPSSSASHDPEEKQHQPGKALYSRKSDELEETVQALADKLVQKEKIIGGDVIHKKISSKVDTKDTEKGTKMGSHQQDSKDIVTEKLQMQGDVKILHEAYRQAKCTHIMHDALKICIHKDNFWVAGGDKGVFVYSHDLELTNRFNLEQLEWVSSVNIHGSDVIVGDQLTGLHMLDKNGTYVNKIASGSFSDSVSLDKKLYAFEHNTKKVHIYSKKSDNSWQLERVIQVSIPSEMYYRMCASGGKYLIFNSDHDRNITVTNLEGHIVYRLNDFGIHSKNFGPDVDNHGIMAVWNANNGKFLAFRLEEKTETAISGFENLKEPISVAIGKKCLLVVSVQENSKTILIKYEAC